MAWLAFEVTGYPQTSATLPQSAGTAVERSGRIVPSVDLPEGVTGPRYRTESLGRLAAIAESSEPVLRNPSTKPYERQAARSDAIKAQAVIDAVLGSIHTYVAEKYQELRFGSAVETAFEVVRDQVDKTIGDLVPNALPMLSAAFENAASKNPEHWANAAGTCRRLLKAVADELRPPGPDVEGRRMGDGFSLHHGYLSCPWRCSLYCARGNGRCSRAERDFSTAGVETGQRPRLDSNQRPSD
ncbi:MAG: hypothetical protein ABW065_02500 [Solirubrobacterales bacterium]